MVETDSVSVVVIPIDSNDLKDLVDNVSKADRDKMVINLIILNGTEMANVLILDSTGAVLWEQPIRD